MLMYTDEWNGFHCTFKTFHRCFVNIYPYDFMSPARNGDLEYIENVCFVSKNIFPL